MTTSWVNGHSADSIAIEDRGLQYGDGLFETITCIDGRPRWLALHLERLRRGCERLELRFDDFESLGKEIGACAAAEGRCIMKLILTRGPARRRGYRPSGEETPTRILTRHDWPRENAEAAAGFRVAVSSVTLGVNPLLAGLKHLNRLEQVLAQTAMRAAPLEEVLMLSSAGDVIGGSMSNVFFADETGLFTPSLANCGVAGVMRQVVCSAAERHGAPVRVRRVERREFARVQEAFLTNVRWGVQSIAQLEGRPLAQRSRAQTAQEWLDAAHS